MAMAGLFFESRMIRATRLPSSPDLTEFVSGSRVLPVSDSLPKECCTRVFKDTSAHTETTPESTVDIGIFALPFLFDFDLNNPPRSER